MKTKLFLSLIFLSILPFLAQAEVNRRDGNSWIEMPPLEKAGYLMGFLDGANLGRNFIVWGFCLDNQSQEAPSDTKGLQQAECAQKVGASFQENSDRYLAHVTVGQLLEGLNVFYKDYRNRKILTVDASWIVLNEIAGTPRPTIDTLIENSRQHAND